MTGLSRTSRPASPPCRGTDTADCLFLSASPIRDDGLPDVAIYNKELEQRGNPSWLNVSWLYSECYLFRYASRYDLQALKRADARPGA